MKHVRVHTLRPGGAKPAGGWPVAIFGHGFSDSAPVHRG